VYIKRVELSHFKSFGGTTQVPLLPGFTVISGPNGSGKSNILDGLLFALGLAGSKGMRAERLPDLVNHNHTGQRRQTVEASVTVTFCLNEEDWVTDEDEETPDVASEEAPNGSENGQNAHPQTKQLPLAAKMVPFNEWSVTRKLRVTPQGTYTSTYSINGETCTLNELHEQLHKFRIYPEGYNVVLQGDVTGIISMNPKERREIIDELAGVAAFDRKILQAKDKLDAVKEREERFRIVEKELIAQRDRLAQDRIKAEKYQRLKAELQTKTQWEGVLIWRQQQCQMQQLLDQLVRDDRKITELHEQLNTLNTEILQATAELERLNAHVKALGEDEQLALQSQLATREAELRQLQRQEQELLNASRETTSRLERTQREIQEQMRQLEQIAQDKAQIEQSHLPSLQADCDRAQQALLQSREAANAIAAASDAWIQEQSALRQQIETLLQQLEPQRTEQARLQERVNQLQQKIQEHQAAIATASQSLEVQRGQSTQTTEVLNQEELRVERLQKLVARAEQELQIQRETETRLLQEQRDKQRQLDKLEAQTQAMQEAQGTGATQIILQMGLPGVCGLVAHLGRVDPQYQLALEIAAGARLGNLVVEDDAIAAAGIELLKQKRAGRATFLPLNKLKAAQLNSIPAWKRPQGFIDYAVNLIECEKRYQIVFAYVFGSTVIFKDLAEARRYVGEYRIVTLDGELLETSGAMTGGSVSSRSNALRFGTAQSNDSDEMISLRERLKVIDRVLSSCQQAIAQANLTLKERTHELTEARQTLREVQLHSEQLQRQIQQLTAQSDQFQFQLTQNIQEQSTAQGRLQQLESEIPTLETELHQQRQALAELEQSQTHSEWQQIQATLRTQEAQLSDRQLALRTAEQRLQDLSHQSQRLQDKIGQQQQSLQENRSQQTNQFNQRATLSEQQTILQAQIQQSQVALAQLEQTLTTEKQERDRAERQLRERQTMKQQLEWQVQKLQETQHGRRIEISELEAQVTAKQAELPDPLPDIPEETRDLAALQHELRSLQKRLQAMEPVNMLALEEYERTQARLDELSQKLSTLEEERTELLLRIENFTTLRQRAFKEAFDVVNKNFQNIFAELSDGDGYLQLDDPNNPFESGLNLVAHPKGKPVRRLASMSGGEKSLTALSFIFALQRYRPSPFYAFDEVDMFLDGANVERLARMIKQHAQQAQFIVVSLRRPMIESAERTIGVTQARGAYTQVLGLDLQTQSASG
jgi:chromosome segregation protein